MAEDVYAVSGTAGACRLPVLHIERASITDDFLDGICEGPGAPGRLMRLAGPLGSGRTTLLEDMAHIAEGEGWRAIKVSGTEVLKDAVSGLGALPESSPDGCLPGRPVLRHLIEHVTANLSDEGRGLALLVDDAQEAKSDELALLAECVQYEIREGHDIALVLAGTRESMLACADGAGMGFLSRAKTEDLRTIPEDESAPALEEALLAAGFALEDGALPQLLDAAQGHAALLQCIWRSLASLPPGASITPECARRCAAEAQLKLSQKLLSGIDAPALELLSALARNRKPQALGSVRAELHMDEAEAASAADELKARQLLEETAPGCLALAHPCLGNYLLKHAGRLYSASS